MSSRRYYLLLSIPFLLAACGRGPERAPAISDAYVGPYHLEIISELSPEAPAVVSLSHGEHVEITEWRRRFARIRTARGEEGWADGRMLLSAAQMARLGRLTKHAERLPSEGKVTVYDTLNIHTEPNRAAPSFYQMEEGNLAEVVAQRVFRRGPYTPPEDSAPDLVPLNSYNPPDHQVPGSGPLEDWSVIRLSDHRAGWALSRMLVMAIPDEVAQYSEGHRITAYASLGRVEDQGQTKRHWLWTTQSHGGRPFQFDGFRVFVWSTRRHRYETAYRERNLTGYFPVRVRHPTDGNRRGGVLAEFSLVIAKGDGRLYQRTYSFSGYRVRPIGEKVWDSPFLGRTRPQSEYVHLPPGGKPSTFQRLVDSVLNFFSGSDDDSGK